MRRVKENLKPYAYKQWEHYGFGQCDRVPFA